MTRGWTQRSPHWASVIEAFHRFEVRGRLGAGGMAEIFLAEEKEPPHRRVALKRLLPEQAEQEELRAMFLDEARLGMRLTHPSLCRVYDAGLLEGDLIIAMEHVDGVTLADLIDRAAGGLPVEVALSIIADVAGALDSVHRARDEHGRPLGIVHRDVSPRNVMIGFDGRVKLLDFGLAKSALNHAITRPGMAKGKLAYLAPELWNEARPDARADLFSLGVCLFEALTGTRLYHRTSPFESRDAILTGPVPSLADHRKDLPPALDHIVRRCLAKHPHGRPESAGALHTALMELLEVTGRRPEPGAVERLVSELFREERERGPVLVPTRFGARASSEPPPPPASSEPPAPIRSEPPPVLLPVRRSRGVLLGGAAAALALALSVVAIGMRESTASTQELHRPIGARPTAQPFEPAPEDEVEVAPPRVAIAVPEPEPEPEPEPAPAVRPARLERGPAAQGAISVNTRPWSEVRLDGREIGTTPIGELPVAAGTHELIFVDRDGREHRATVDVGPGETTRVFRDLAAPVDAPRAEAIGPGDPGPS